MATSATAISGLPVTSPERTVDTLEADTQPEQIKLAFR
jgi:hypothetical protein